MQYANFSSWDLYKSQNQLLALIQPRRYREMLLSLLADYREGGKLPRWGEQNVDAAHMSGDPAIPAIAEGVCRGLLDALRGRGAVPRRRSDLVRAAQAGAGAARVPARQRRAPRSSTASPTSRSR